MGRDPHRRRSPASRPRPLLGGRGPYVLHAAIASLQAEEVLDWPQIAALYGELVRLTGSPVVELNRAVAVAETEGPRAALRIVDGLDLDQYQYLHSTRAELLRRLGRVEEARSAYRRALGLAKTEPERRFLAKRLADLSSLPRTSPFRPFNPREREGQPDRGRWCPAPRGRVPPTAAPRPGRTGRG